MHRGPGGRSFRRLGRGVSPLIRALSIPLSGPRFVRVRPSVPGGKADLGPAVGRRDSTLVPPYGLTAEIRPRDGMVAAPWVVRGLWGVGRGPDQERQSPVASLTGCGANPSGPAPPTFPSRSQTRQSLGLEATGPVRADAGEKHVPQPLPHRAPQAVPRWGCSSKRAARSLRPRRRGGRWGWRPRHPTPRPPLRPLPGRWRRPTHPVRPPRPTPWRALVL